MLHTLCAVVIGMTAGFENVVEADQIALDVRVGVGDAVAHTCLCRKVDDDVRLVIGKDTVDQRLVGKITLDELPAHLLIFGGKLADLLKSILLERHVIVVVHIVEPNECHRLVCVYQLRHQIRADKTRGSGDQERFVCESVF